jgi:two-component system, LytTR family, response regulator
LRALIVDDEPLARRGVAVRLQKCRDVEIVGECADGTSAVESILSLSPDVVFLDVQMPGMDGFEVLRALPKQDLPAVIFLTAYEQHAVRAFDVHALDYLLKPVDDERFAASVERARKLVDSASKTAMAERILRMLGRDPEKYVSRFTVRTGSRIQIVLAEDVEWIGAAGDYAELHTRGRSHLLRETMSSLEHKLDPANLVHAAHAAGARGAAAVSCAGFLRFLDVGHQSFGGEHEARDGSGVLQSETSNLGRVDHACLDQVAVLAGVRVVAKVLVLGLADFAQNDGTFVAGIVAI